MRLGTAEQGGQLVRLMGRYGFEPAGEVLQPGTWQSGSLHHYGENLLIFMLVLATILLPRASRCFAATANWCIFRGQPLSAVTAGPGIIGATWGIRGHADDG